MGKRKRYSATFKASVAREAIRGEEPLARLAARFGIHPSQVSRWKKQALDGLNVVFSGKPERAGATHETRELHDKVGQLTVEELNFLAHVSGAEPGPEEQDGRPCPVAVLP